MWKGIEAKRSTAKFCCEACKKKAKRARARKIIKCVSCGRSFKPTHGSQLYCSDDCKAFEQAEAKRIIQHAWGTMDFGDDTYEDDLGDMDYE